MKVRSHGTVTSSKITSPSDSSYCSESGWSSSVGALVWATGGRQMKRSPGVETGIAKPKENAVVSRTSSDQRDAAGITSNSSASAQSVATMRAPRIVKPESVSPTIWATTSEVSRCAGFERSTCGLTSTWVVIRSFSRTWRWNARIFSPPLNASRSKRSPAAA